MNLSKQVRNNDNSSNSINRAIVDYTSPALCTPVTPSRRQVMGSIVNVPEEDRATDIGNTHKKFGKDRACGSGDILADSQPPKQTDIQTQTYLGLGILVTILPHPLRGRGNEHIYR